MNNFALPWHPDNLIDSGCNSSSTEAGVKVAITSHGPTPSVGDTHYRWREDSIPHYYTAGQARPHLPIRRLFSHVLVVPPPYRRDTCSRQVATEIAKKIAERLPFHFP
ncbi:hypothetical protein AVEN_142099-1 [Araneus ventricosus]|uniref:Uncharacterized protein n=1 Tax=Araneus ventricosus TaxID=182803 RepID=A0A4Y2HZP6_ARAVE|nr:hypothetical protein AVEN_142099-1 [Araneus ventricosus]